MSMLNTFFYLVKNDRHSLGSAIDNRLYKNRLIRKLNDEKYIKLRYFLIFGKKLNLDNPQTFNEKINWLKLYDRKPEYTMMADKYRVRKYISSKIGEEHLIPLIGVWKCAEDINFDALPNQFVLKCNHDSGSVIICKNKEKLNIEETRKKLNGSLNSNLFEFGREWAYKDIKPCIIAEQYMADDDDQLKDYKIFCFDGEPKYVQVDFDRFINHQRNLYTINWEFIDATITYKNNKDFIIKKPDCFEEMLDYARILSKGIPHVRVDFYYVDNKIYFGELTFYHGSGFEKFTPDSLGYEFGKWIHISNVFSGERL